MSRLKRLKELWHFWNYKTELTNWNTFIKSIKLTSFWYRNKNQLSEWIIYATFLFNNQLSTEILSINWLLKNKRSFSSLLLSNSDNNCSNSVAVINNRKLRVSYLWVKRSQLIFEYKIFKLENLKKSKLCHIDNSLNSLDEKKYSHFITKFNSVYIRLFKEKVAIKLKWCEFEENLKVLQFVNSLFVISEVSKFY